MTPEEIESRTLNDADLEGFGRRVADHAREDLEAADITWRYMPCFRDAVAKAAADMLKIVVTHERGMAKLKAEIAP
jgi:hypothetical protein